MPFFRIVLASFLLFVSAAYAAEGGRLGYGISLQNVAVEDPDGDVPTESGIGFVNLYYFDEFRRDIRYYAEFVYFETDIDAKYQKIGQDISSTGIRAVLQKRLRLGRHFKPWVGLGGGLFREEFTQRHTIDQDGFLLSTLSARDITNFMVSVDAATEWELSNRFDLGVRLLYGLPLNDGTQLYSATAILMFKGF